MKAEIKYLHSPDIYDLETFKPDVDDEFSFLLQVMASPNDCIGEESFNIIVGTLKALISFYQKYRNCDDFFTYHHLIVKEYNYDRIHKKIKDYIEGIEEDTWDKIAHRINLIGHWEFFNYHETQELRSKKNIKFDIKNVFSPRNGNLESFEPEAKDNFILPIHLSIRSKSKVGLQKIIGQYEWEVQGKLAIKVCTPKGLEKELEKDDMLFGYQYLIVGDYNYDKIYNKIKDYIDGIEEDTWDKIAHRINLIGQWEYSDNLPFL